ncbi:MAG: PhzF family phenazine biosynthesis protein [Candidatus Rokubacteria bacterium]|nr:PhzF family phenazine biosynthesis protein [Candidatus Rokubacteria bacterium]
MPAKTYAYLTVDVFTDQPFTGNPLAVVTDARGLLAERAGQALPAAFVFEEIAGLVPVELDRDAGGRVTGATLTAP